MTRNHFPPHYAENISEVNLPAELIPQYTTIEYELQTQTCGAPVFLFVVDTCVDEDELNHLRDSLQQTLNLLPEDSLVGLITFGTLVQVHELGFADCPKSYVFRGEKEYAAQKVQDMLGITQMRNGQVAGGPGGNIPGRQPALGKFLLRAGDCTFALEQVLEDLQRDPWPCKQDERVQRCTGTALSVAMGLLESSVPRQGSRIMMFVSGPPTVGLGMVVNRPKTENIRSHVDIQKNNAPLTKPAMEFNRILSDRAIANSTVVDIFACSLDQVGTLETKVLVSRTGGLFVLADSFGQSVFRESLRRVFEREILPDGTAGNLQMGFGGQIEVLHSREFKIAGAIGPCASMKKAGQSVADTEIGIGYDCN